MLSRARRVVGAASVAQPDRLSLPGGDIAPLATYRPRVTGVEPHPDFGICRACGRGLMLDDGVLPEHPADPEHGWPERTPIPEDHRCRGEGHPPL